MYGLPISASDLATAVSQPYSSATLYDWAATPTSPWISFVGASGDVTCSRTSETRWSANLRVPKDAAPIGEGFLNPYGSLVRIRRQVHFPNLGTYVIPWGIYRVDNVDEAITSFSMSLFSQEAQIRDSRFPAPRSITPGMKRANGEIIYNVGDVVRTLVREAVPTASIVWLTKSRIELRKAPAIMEERERWAMLDGNGDKPSIAKSYGLEMYFNGSGQFCVSDVPSINDIADWTILGPSSPSGGVVIDRTVKQDRDSIYNLIVVSGQSGLQVPIGPFYAWDSDPASPTYAGPDPVRYPERSGPFGVIPRFYSSPLVNTSAQGNRAARAILSTALGLRKTLSGSALANPAIEAGDTVMYEGQRFVIDSWKCSTESNFMSFETRTIKYVNDVVEDDVEFLAEDGSSLE